MFEVLSGPDGRGGAPGGGVLGRRMEPIQVNLPRQDALPPGSGRGDVAHPARKAGVWNPVSISCLIAAGLMLVIAGVWYVAYTYGKKDQTVKELDKYLQPDGGAAITPGTPLNPTIPSASGSTPVPPMVAPPIAPEPVNPLADPRKPGNNYLHIVTLSWHDAEKAVAFLGRNGVPAAAVPARKVDPAEARAKNQPHLIFALEGVPSEQYSALARKRSDLEAKIRSIGKRWQKEERGPSDFGETIWALFKEPGK